jgi:two-component system, NtrC family, response regulator AtoC
MANAILIIEDEPILTKNIQRYLQNQGYEVRSAGTIKDGLALAQSFQPDLILLDYMLPDGNALDSLGRIKSTFAGSKFIMMTGHASIEIAVSAMKQDATDFITKPIILEELRLLLDKVFHQERLDQTISYFKNKESAKGGLNAIRGESPAILKLKALIRSLTDADRTLEGEVPPPVLITGETGTGKQLVARALHFDSPRAVKPFIELNCAALPESLVESELFGHERGAFTDAKERKTGLIEAADGGTLFLDEIGELPLVTQAKLLKVLENQTLRRMGSIRERHVKVRIIGATNRSLTEMVQNGEFRADLYYRLQMIEIDVPPLRDRGNDAMLLAEHFLQQSMTRYKKQGLHFTEAAREAVGRYDWQGNVRELRNAVERAVLLAKGEEIGASIVTNLPFRRAPPRPAPVAKTETGEASPTPNDINMNLPAAEKNMLIKALETTKWNVSSASRLLGVSRDTLRYRMEKFDLHKPGADQQH